VSHVSNVVGGNGPRWPSALLLSVKPAGDLFGLGLTVGDVRDVSVPTASADAVAYDVPPGELRPLGAAGELVDRNGCFVIAAASRSTRCAPGKSHGRRWPTNTA